ncbi:FAD/NAD(P)-binding protein [Vibrio spartinae]|uniref:FAD-dependent urate hydroxylase HpyO/Asp monooxygenase CreE-like FAD/NAD(P)-binding domain-containing protein n=1 Tax=Vibrio spartinae TaxID=1918945 RepID=A0A1N6MBS0_9VIBR|nr:FAD/NAD(P)-binding protein [Vibrio spartinae]SIO96885.1 hypothetical protein VSP9026_04711 [Vibrio spartinae]
MNSYKIAIIGNGPRGLSVLERLSFKLSSFQDKLVDIYYLDKSDLDTGRIWKENQCHSFIMNTVADEVSAFSGLGDVLNAKPGSGPSLATWWKHFHPSGSGEKEYKGENIYAPRYLYGEYMKFVLHSIKNHLHPNHHLIQEEREIVDMVLETNEVKLIDSNSKTLSVDRVVIATGHSHNQPTQTEDSYQSFVNEHTNCTWIPGDSVADMNLDKIKYNEQVGVIGLGLSFLDIVMEFTEGRGGKFVYDQNNCLNYVPSGREPKIFAGSRSSLPIPGRGKNQKDPNHIYNPLFFTNEKIVNLTKNKKVSFNDEIMPLIMGELNLIYYATYIRNTYGLVAEKEFISVLRNLKDDELISIPDIAINFGADIPKLDLFKLSHPFDGKKFTSIDDFTNNLYDVLENDYNHACNGNIDDPLKAALDTLRDIRPQVRAVVDFGQLTPDSYYLDFRQKYSPISMLLSAGPPRFRTEQIMALIKKGILTIVGPNISIKADEEKSLFKLCSHEVENSDIYVSTLIDSRLPSNNFQRETSILLNNMKKNNILSPFVIRDYDKELVTDGISITTAPYHPIDVNGKPAKNLYLLGIPCEHTRWFMSAGSSRPGFWTDFIQDAEAISTDIIDQLT